MTVEHWIDLSCHPSTRPETVRAIAVLVRRSASAELQMTFRLDGDIPRIWVSSPGVPRIATQLWRHTCFEAFIAVEGQPAYHEFNFAPSGEWAVYAFCGYRNGGPLANEMTRPHIAVRSTDSRLELDTLIRLDGVSAIHPRASLRIGLSAVIEASDGLSYWALRHPADKPDFHDADGFALLLEPLGPEWQVSTAVKFGIDRLLEETALRKPLVSQRAALLAHPAATHDLVRKWATREQVESAC